jgi:hypothetical protein
MAPCARFQRYRDAVHLLHALGWYVGEAKNSFVVKARAFGGEQGME